DGAGRAQRADVNLARQAYLEAFHAAMHAGRFDPASLLEVGRAALACPAAEVRDRPHNLLLEGLATRVVGGYSAAAPILREALAPFRRETSLPPEDARWLFLGFRVASDLWDAETHELLASRELDRARKAGALAELPRVLASRINGHAI